MFDRDFISSLPRDDRQEDAARKGALDGVKVLDFTHYIAGAYATMILADLGASVLKIERPGTGDDFRYYPPHAEGRPADGAPFLWTNRNKQSLALNLKHPLGLDTAARLAERCDVLIENFSTGVMERLGLGYETVRARNPKVVYCSISAYGRTGESSHRPGFDSVVQGESGFVSMNGYPDRQGVRTGAPVMDIATAMMSSSAVIAALYHCAHSEHGQYVEIGMFDTALNMTGYAASQTLCSGKSPNRHGNVSPDTVPTGMFCASDTNFYLHCGNTAIFMRLFRDVVGRPDIADNPEFADGAGRMQRRNEIYAVLEDIFPRRPWAEWRTLMAEAGVPAGEIRDLKGALLSAEAAERELVTRIPHPVLGWVPNLASPMRFSSTPVRAPVAAPTIGQHTAEALADWLGLDEETIAQGLSDGVYAS